MRKILPVFLPLEPCESFNGYLLRRAELNAYQSLHDITRLVDAPTSTRDMAVAQAHMKDLCELLEVEEEQGRNRLFWRTGAGSRTRAWTFNGKPLGNGMVDLRRPKVCPECLDERRIIPAEWELTFFTVCPRHQRPLVEACAACGMAISWGRSHLAVCQGCCHPLEPSTAVSSSHESQLAQLICNKLHHPSSDLSRTRGFGPLADISLNGLLELSLFLGALSSGVNRLDPTHVARFSLARRQEVMRAASSFVNCDWPTGFHKHVEAVLAHQPSECRSARDLLPGFYGPLARRYRREGFDQLVAEVGRFLAQEHPRIYARFHGRSAVALQLRGELGMESVSDFCKRAGIKMRQLRDFAMQLNIELPEGDGSRLVYRRLMPDEVRRLEELIHQMRHRRAHTPIQLGEAHLSSSAFRSGQQFPAPDIVAPPGSTLPISHVTDRLGIHEAAAVKIMKRVGALLPRRGKGAHREASMVDASRYAEWERRISKLVSSDRNALDEPRRSIGDAVRDKLRRYDVDLAWVIGCILDGDVVVVGIDPKRHGIYRLLVADSEIDRLALRAKAASLGKHMDAATATELLNLPRDNVIYELRKSGHVTGTQTGAKGGGTILFDRGSIEKFRAQYVTLTELRKCGIGTNGVAIRKRLREAGIEPRFTLPVSGRATPFYSREDCRGTFSIP